MKTYTCPICKATYNHDQGYRHAMYECPKKPNPAGAGNLDLQKEARRGEVGH